MVRLGFQRQQVGRVEPWLRMCIATDRVSTELNLNEKRRLERATLRKLVRKLILRMQVGL